MSCDRQVEAIRVRFRGRVCMCMGACVGVNGYLVVIFGTAN